MSPEIDTVDDQAKDRLHVRFHRKAKHHYYRVMPDNKHHRTLVWVVFFVFSGLIAVQLLYPPDRALPLARIDGEYVIWQQENEIMSRATEQFQATKLKLVVEGGEPKEYLLARAGAHIEADQIARAVTDYPFWQRYIPFSILMPRSYDSRDSIQFTSSVLATFSDTVAAELGYAPEDARLQFKEGVLEAYSEKSGRTVDSKALARKIQKHATAAGQVIVLTAPSKKVVPTTTAHSLQEVRGQAERALEIPLSLTADGTVFTPSRTERASWLLLGENEEGATELRFDPEALNRYLATLDKEVGTPAGQTRITLVDGRETARQAGSVGRTIDTSAALTAIQSHILEGAGSDVVELSFRQISPQIIYNESYTATQEGLRVYANDAARRYNSAIAIQQIGGDGWSAEGRADVSMPSASTYKLYIAKMLFDRIDRGEVGWGDRMLDTTVSVCFDRMTIASTNACAEEWIRQFGRTNINNTLYGLGLGHGTTFTNPTATHTTARDLRRFMIGVEDGSIIGGGNRDRLLRSLSTHSFRQGIPAGSKGRVYDKVGFLWDYTHDAAIVYHPKGTYVMVVMTKGQSYARIAAITREVEKIMYP